LPEGDTIFRAARALHRALAGGVITRFESAFPSLSRITDDRPLVGRTMESVAARGKHLLMTLSGDLVLRTHMRMNGCWHLYRPGARWKRSARDMRLLIATSEAVAVGFNVPVAEFLTARDVARHRELQALGPDLLADTFDRAGVVRRMRAFDARPIDEVLLDQRVVSGIGNVFKSEVLFLAGIHPRRAIASMETAELERALDVARAQLTANVLTSAQTLSPVLGRRTTRSLDPSAKLWVYGRGGQPCRRCGAILVSEKTGDDARLTYWCPRCQPDVRSKA
jgi:endonuclease-8